MHPVYDVHVISRMKSHCESSLVKHMDRVFRLNTKSVQIKNLRPDTAERCQTMDRLNFGFLSEYFGWYFGVI